MPISKLMITHKMGQGVSHHFMDAKLAIAAYEKIKAALAEYKSFSNEKERTVEIDLESGKSIIRLEDAAGATLNIGNDNLDKKFYQENKRQQKMFGLKKKK